MSLPKFHAYDDEPDVSDFEQSDEHASEYEEDQRVRELLKDKIYTTRMKHWWSKRKLIGLRLIRVAVLFIAVGVPIFWALQAIHEISEEKLGLFIGILGAFLATMLTWLVIILFVCAAIGIYLLCKWAFGPLD
jgi:fatty acid desaturase